MARRHGRVKPAWDAAARAILRLRELSGTLAVRHAAGIAPLAPIVARVADTGRRRRQRGDTPRAAEPKAGDAKSGSVMLIDVASLCKLGETALPYE
jgi:hypothetical protein